jgi:hypothetical protein
MRVEACADEFRDLVGKELMAQLATIDAELRALGVDPGPIPVLEGSPAAGSYWPSTNARQRSNSRRWRIALCNLSTKGRAKASKPLTGALWEPWGNSGAVGAGALRKLGPIQVGKRSICRPVFACSRASAAGPVPEREIEWRPR